TAMATEVHLAAFPHPPDSPTHSPSLQPSRMPESISASSYRRSALPALPSSDHGSPDRKTFPDRCPLPFRILRRCIAAPGSRLDLQIGSAESHNCNRRMSGPTVAAKPAKPPAG